MLQLAHHFIFFLKMILSCYRIRAMIFKYSDYKVFLRDIFQGKVLGYNYSLRSFSRDLGVDHTVLSRVLNGKRKLPLNISEEVAEKIGLNSIEIEYFLLLVEYDHVCSLRAKKLLENEIKSIQAQRTLPQMNKETFEIVADFTTFSILELLDIPKVSASSSLISKVLGVDISQVRNSLQVLKKSGVVSQDERGEYFKSSSNLNFKVNTSNSSVEKFFKDSLERAIEELNVGIPEKRIYRTRIISIPKSFRREICSKII